MATSLPLPYDLHPAFRSEAPELEVDLATVEVFERAYRTAEQAGGEVARQQSAALRDALRRIFESIVVGDDQLRQFLSELRSLCERLLDADLDHFIAQRDVTTSEAADQRDLLAALRDRRFFFDFLSEGTLRKLHDISNVPLAQLRAAAADGRTAREDLSINYGSVAKRLVRAVDDEYERRGFNDIVSLYARRTMRVTGCALELSVPTATWWQNRYELPRPPLTLYAHTDEGLAHPKSIVYLTDVGPESGPMSVFPGCEARLELRPLQKLVGRIVSSVGADRGSSLFQLYERDASSTPFLSQAFRRHFAVLPEAMRYNSHFGWDVIPDSELERTLSSAETKMLAPAGGCVIFDGARIIHRGGLVERGERVALQIVFSEPRSRAVHVAGRILDASKQTLQGPGTFSTKVREVRRRVGRLLQQHSRRPHDRLVRSIARLLPDVACVDVGASYYPHGPWEVFRASRKTLWIAVEPNAANTSYLDTWSWPSRTHLVPTGLSEHGGSQVLYVTNTDSGSSLLPPVINVDMEHRVHDRDYFFPVTERSIETMSLDHLLGEVPGVADRPVVLKLDTQGTELAILRGANSALARQRIVGIESEATLLANPVMVGAGKFWQLCQFLETNGFELVQLKPIEGGPTRPGRRTYLNECDAVFCLRRSVLMQLPIGCQLAALGFYLSYHLNDEARALFDAIDGIGALCRDAGVDAAEVRSLFES